MLYTLYLFFLTDTATTEIYTYGHTLSLHDALPICFLVMDRISGVSLPMHPSYHVAGLLHELDPATRREAWFGAINTISQINKLPWREDFGFLHNSEYGAPGLDAYLGWLGAWRDLACAGEKHPVVDAAMAYMTERMQIGRAAWREKGC